MKIIDQLKRRSSLVYPGVLIIGIFLGWAIFGNGGSTVSSDGLHEDHVAEDHQSSMVYTCAMHPQIREDKPGDCPICGMELVPLQADEDEGEVGDYSVKLTNAAMKIAEVSTSVIQRTSPYKEVYLPGKVLPDERRISELTARYPGRIEKLHVNFTGQKVRKGQILAQIYSPELVTTQKELFEAMKLKDTNPNYYLAVRNKLKLWDLTETQIDEIATLGEVKFYFDVLSPLSGTVTMRHVTIGDYVREGTALFEIIDLSHVWVVFDAYESDIPWIKLRDKIKFTIKSIPDEIFESTVNFIDPVINPQTRVAGVRAELNNSKNLLKPHMLASGILKTMLPGDGDQMIIPKSAVLWTGKKSVVYVRTNNHDNMFRYTEVILGADAGDYYVVSEGLNEGDLVASNGAFKIDAAAQLRGKQSMMNPGGGKVSLAHDHGSMGSEGQESVPEVDHSGHEMESGDQPEMGIVPAFQKQLTTVYEEYLNVKNAFVESNAKKVSEKVVDISRALDKTDMSLLKGEAHMAWMENLETINKSLEELGGTTDLASQRKSFAILSDALYKSISDFGIKTDKPVYYQYCPMAIDDQGAFWLSEFEEIANPYFGEMMLRCGETRETIEFK